MYIFTTPSQGLVHNFYYTTPTESDVWDLREIADLYTLVKEYFFKLTHRVAKGEEEMIQYFSNLLNIENVSLLKIARSLERHQFKPNYKLTQESLVGIGAKLEE